MRAMPSAKKPLDALTARDVMQTHVLTVSLSTPLSEVERVLGEHRIGGAPVTDEAGHIVGVVSVRDLLERYTQDPDAQPRRGPGFYHASSQEMADEDYEDLDSFNAPAEGEETVSDIMNSDVYSVPAAATLSTVAAQMIKHKIHRILVEDSKKYIGLITTFDLLSAVAD